MLCHKPYMHNCVVITSFSSGVVSLREWDGSGVDRDLVGIVFWHHLTSKRRKEPGDWWETGRGGSSQNESRATYQCSLHGKCGGIVETASQVPLLQTLSSTPHTLGFHNFVLHPLHHLIHCHRCPSLEYWMWARMASISLKGNTSPISPHRLLQWQTRRDDGKRTTQLCKQCISQLQWSISQSPQCQSILRTWLIIFC